MLDLKTSSLGDQISKKVSGWILILITTITIGTFFVSYLLSRQLFNQQVSTWVSTAPQTALINLIDSDHFSIKREIDFLESTSLFSSFSINDNQKRVIAEFGHNNHAKLIPIRDETGVVWGYHSYATDFLKFFSPFLITGGVFLFLVFILYVVIRWRIKSDLEVDFLQFNRFLNEIELITEKISEIYYEDGLKTTAEPFKTAEQEVINRTISRLVNEIRKANKSLREAILEAEQKLFQEELTRTALQVAHDIGSPLAVLETIVQSSSIAMPEESRISVRNAASRIRDISGSLLGKAKKDLLASTTESFKQQELFSLLMQVIVEKRLQYRSNSAVQIDFDFDKTSYGLFAMLKQADFGRILSNIINNAVEAIKNKGCIVVQLSKLHDYSVITIKDDGVGIPRHILQKIGELGLTYGKTAGSGLGLYHAKSTIESWGGALHVFSEVGQGTTVEIHLPVAQHPIWHVPEIVLLDKQKVVIIDDDDSIHDVWRRRIKQFQEQTGKLVDLRHFHSPSEFIKWKEAESLISTSELFFCDYEFIGSDINGIELINKLKINYLSILVTSRFDTEEVVLNCEALGIKLLAKDMAGIIPIVPGNTIQI